MPLDSTKPIPDGWDDHHRPVATATMTARCSIDRRTARGTYNPVTLTHAADTTVPVYTGPCRIQQNGNQSAALDYVGQLTTTSTYLVAIEHDTAVIAIDDLVTVLDAVDPHLAGRKLRVLSIQYGSHEWQRNLTCEDFEG